MLLKGSCHIMIELLSLPPISLRLGEHGPWRWLSCPSEQLLLLWRSSPPLISSSVSLQLGKELSSTVLPDGSVQLPEKVAGPDRQGTPPHKICTAWEDCNPKVKFRSFTPKKPRDRGEDKGMRIRFDTNYLVLAGVK